MGRREGEDLGLGQRVSTPITRKKKATHTMMMRVASQPCRFQRTSPESYKGYLPNSKTKSQTEPSAQATNLTQ